jgi:hypothetical protein
LHMGFLYDWAALPLQSLSKRFAVSRQQTTIRLPLHHPFA